MSFHALAPTPRLAGRVESFWYVKSGPAPHAQERALPEGTVELVIDLRDPPLTRLESTVAGPHSAYFLLDTATSVEVVGAHFAPGGAFPFLGLPAYALHNTCVEPEDLWGASAARTLRQKLLDTPTPIGRMRELERFLLSRPASRWQPHRAVGWALGQFHAVPHEKSIAQVRAATGLSSTRFIELFRREVGLTPKLFCRIQRFQATLRRIERCNSEPHWADLAYDCGYADQAHLVREIRAFTGRTPTTYLQSRTGRLNHLRHDA